MANLDLCYTPAVTLARLIAAREISPVEVVANSLERIEEINPRLNCFCFTYPEEAIEEAEAAERAVMEGGPLGPLHGVPIAIKDFTPTAGKTTTMGSKVYRDHVPAKDARVVSDLLGAGAIMVGKTTTPEFAHDGFTHSPLWGVTRNPWNPDRTPGGSSGGSGAAVASGCVPTGRGFRHGRIGAHSGCLLRHRRPQAESGPDPDDHPRVGLRQHQPLRALGPDPGRCGPLSRRLPGT